MRKHELVFCPALVSVCESLLYVVNLPGSADPVPVILITGACCQTANKRRLFHGIYNRWPHVVNLHTSEEGTSVHLLMLHKLDQHAELKICLVQP